MAGERLTTEANSVETGFSHVGSMEVDGSANNEPSFLKYKENSVAIFVSPPRIIAKNKDTLLYIPYTLITQLRLDEKGLVINSFCGDQKLTLHAVDGGIIFEQNSQASQGQETSQITERKAEDITYTMTKAERATLKGLSLGQTIRYHIRSSGLPREEIVKGFGMKDSTIKGYEIDKRIPRKVPNYEEIFNWKQGDPRAVDLRAKHKSRVAQRIRKEQ